MKRLLALLFLFFTAPALALMGDDLLEPEKAFALEASVEDDTLVAEWRIADGYYMYKEQFAFESETEGVTLGEPRIPDGTIKEDEFFGRVETYRDHIRIEVPIQRANGATDRFDLKARSQGCADIGVCYPPLYQTVSLDLPAAPETTRERRNGAVGALSGLAGMLGGGADELLEPEKAFQLSVEPISQNAVLVRWTIADGYYLYRDKLDFRIVDGDGNRVGPVNPPEGEKIEDEFFGLTETYRHEVEIMVPILREDGAANRVTLEADYQGCADLGVCYPPLAQTASFEFTSELAESVDIDTAAAPDTRPAPPVSEQDRIAAQLADGRLWLVALAFFGFGLLLTFTPCVFPMIPILSNIIIGQKNLTTRKAFFISLIFVLAMALTYTVAGVFAGLAGANLQAAFQNPWIIGGFVAVFIALAMSMFGFYDLQMPAGIQTRLSNLSNRQEGGTFVGAGIMGFLSALIVGPCVTAPLVGALLYISQTGDAFLGGLALFALSMGMGVPLLIIGTAGGKILPRAGAWMDAVKAVFGVALLGMGIWLLERVVPMPVAMFLWGTLLIVSGIYMGALHSLTPEASGWRTLWKGFGLVILVWGVLLMIGSASGGRDVFQPLRGIMPTAAVTSADGTVQPTRLEFRNIDSVADLEREVAEASAQGQPVMLDFYADWCVDCVRLERTTFRDPGVIQALSGTRLLKADVTANTSEHRDLMRHFNLFGPPAIVFYDDQGNELRDYRLVGFIAAGRFTEHVTNAIGG
ncbi:thiol:disulfide interchange protein [Thioalkalivibrio denitrificans]|uniref:Thiol:disulfide interchange protein DsbD n=1 Tax=Thioalkalivibrio denitrificans TaxID=108003 RepID=A0A1V3NDU6_9GAMM|nr:protein-disulfide reductase DsbD [Thioalkalivibrio denitrificans]OOG23205.1 thiol:disulfide interchange protein [Thioalkalivibrio denitrificans]